MRISDWSSDVCSSDLGVSSGGQVRRREHGGDRVSSRRDRDALRRSVSAWTLELAMKFGPQPDPLQVCGASRPAGFAISVPSPPPRNAVTIYPPPAVDFAPRQG